MQSKIPSKSKWSLFIVSIVVIAFFSIIIFFLNSGMPSQDSYAKASIIRIQAPKNPIKSNTVESIQAISPPKRASLGPSLRLKIPKINVDAKVESVGLTPQGTMGVPKSPTTVGWYDLGPRPGETGTAVIDGHSGFWKNGTLGVFNNLNKLQKGDKLSFEDEKGAITTFVVHETRSYDPNADASEVFASSDEKSHLNLITCEGVWDKTSKSYSSRLVIFTDKE